MNKYFSKGLPVTLIIGAIFVFSTLIPTVSVSAQSQNICQVIDMFINAGLIAPGKADAARLAGGCPTSTPAPETPTTPVCTQTLARNLSVGSSGADVVTLQKFLIKNGNTTLQGTGSFGSLTKAAVMKFQVANGISPVTGFVGPATRAFINNLLCGTTTSQPSITITSPNGGETWPVGNDAQFSIAWSYQNIDSASQAQIYLQFTNGTVCNLGSSPIGAKLFWTIPENQGCIGQVDKKIVSGQYKAGVIVGDQTGGTFVAKDYSDNYFNITMPDAVSDQTDPAVSITGTPTLSLIYNNDDEESQLVATFKISVTAGDQDLYVYKNVNPVLFVNQSNSNQNYSGAITVMDSSADYSQDKNGREYFLIPEGAKETFTVTSVAEPKKMFAGYYKAKFGSIVATNGNPNKAFSLSPDSNQYTSSKLIVGEVSPYITSVSASTTYDGVLVSVNGARLANSNSVNVINNPGKIWNIKTNSSGKNMEFMMGIYPGNFNVQVIDPKTGASNLVQFTVLDITQPSLTISTLPNESVFSANETYRIRWNASSNITTINLASYFDDSVKGGYFAQGIPASQGYFDYKTGPSPVAAAYILEANGLDKYNNIIATAKKSFTITSATQPSLTVNYPKGGENMVTGDPILIKWTPSSSVSNIEIVKSDGGYSFGIYGPKYGNNNPITSGVFNYTLSGSVPSGMYYVKLTTIDGNTHSNSNMFGINMINKASITVTSPNGGEQWKVGETYNITWLSQGSNATDYNVQLEIFDNRYSNEDNDRSSATIVHSIPNTGSYSWTIPQSIGGLLNFGNVTQPVYKMAVHSWSDSTTGTALGGSSVSPFTITAPVVNTPSAPILTAQTSSTCGNRIKLSWNKVTGAQEYQIFRNGDLLYYQPASATSIESNLGSASDKFAIKVNTGVSLSSLSESVSATPSVSCVVTPAVCTTFSYSAWGTCSDGVQTRTLDSTGPSGCTGGDPVLTQSCIVPTVTSFVTLNYVKIDGNTLRISYGKNFNTCVHLLNTNSQPLHTQNLLCQQGDNIEITATVNDFQVVADQKVKVCHGNNYGICSDYVIVTSSNSTATSTPTTLNTTAENYATASVGWETFLKLLNALK